MAAQITSPILKCAGHAGLPKYVFVLSLENRSFDHIFGRSGITGKDAATKKPGRAINGVLDGSGNIDPKYTNAFGGQTFGIPNNDAPFIMPSDPKHEYEHILCQTCGPDAVRALIKNYAGAPDKMSYVDTPDSDPSVASKQVWPDIIPVPGQSSPTKSPPSPYARPAPDNSGFVHSYVNSFSDNTKEKGTDNPVSAVCPDPQVIMTCFNTPSQLPVLYKLASSFVICDNFFSSLPGPTGPNRFFMMSGSSAGFDGGPSGSDMQKWTMEGGHLPITKGSVFSHLSDANVPWRIYGDDNFPMAGVMQGVHTTNTFDVHDKAMNFSSLQSELKEATKDKPFPYNFVWIEPDYDVASSLYRHPMYSTGNSMHPCSDVRKAEQLVADIYNWISGNESVWQNCVIFITWDEHGGFYDHVPSPTAAPPGDTPATGRTWDFKFDRLGTRVPCLVISPFIESNLVDNRQYDHGSILATVIDLYNKGAFTNGKAPASKMAPWTSRIQWAKSLSDLFTEDGARAGTVVASATPLEPGPTPADTGTGDTSQNPLSGNTPIFLASAMNLHQSADPSVDLPSTAATFTTNQAAANYFDKVQALVDQAQAKAQGS